MKNSIDNPRMNPIDSATPEEAVNLEPLTRFKYRKVNVAVDNTTNLWSWSVCCGHRSLYEFCGNGTSLADAIYDAGIDMDEKVEFTD